MKSIYKCIIFAVYLLGSVSCSEEEALVVAEAKALKSKADTYRKWHDICLEGKVEDIDKQIKKFEAQLKKDGNDNLARVYLGSSQALRAKYSYWGLVKLKHLRSAEKSLDAAVRNAPNDARVRMVRAIAGYKVPMRFDRRPTALKDFEFLVPIAKNPKGRLKDNERQVILYYGYMAYKDDGRKSANDLKTLCHKISPNTKYGKLTK